MGALSISENKGFFAQLRNSPFFILPLILIGGYALASLSYTLIMENENLSRRATPSVQHVEPVADQARTDVTPVWKPDNPNQVYSAVRIATPTIYLLNSRKTREFFASSGGDYSLFLDQWHYYFQSRGVKYADIFEAELPGLKAGILILPSVVRLDSEDRSAIASFERKGGSVFVTWATGSRDDKGQFAGYGFLRDQFGVSVSGEIAAQDVEKFLVLSGETPVSHTLPAGTRIWLGLDKVREHPLRISGGEYAAGRFLNAVRTPENGVANDSVIYTEQGMSRRVYFAFSESSWQYEHENMYRLLDDTFNWLERRPDAFLANWPYPYRAAQILEMDTEQGYPNATNFASLLNASGLQGTFYSLTSVAVKFPEVVSQLEFKHEIAYHADVHDGFKGQPKEEQSKRMDVMRAQLTPIVKNPDGLRGFRPPYELSDLDTEALLFEKGFGHILANSDNTQSMLPYISLSSHGDFSKVLIVLPRTQRDDMNFAKQGLSGKEMAKVMIDDFNQTGEFGALGVLSVHSQSYETGGAVASATADFVGYIRASGGKTWVAPSGKIEAWWRNRALLKYELTGEPENMQLNVTVGAPGLRWRSAIVILNPVVGAELKIRVYKAGMPEPSVVALDKYRTALVFNTLDAGNFRYHLSY
jgi:peptidoglycan/xylan/chitin deacetylase (PgdA/CDA1 family)